MSSTADTLTTLERRLTSASVAPGIQATRQQHDGRERLDLERSVDGHTREVQIQVVEEGEMIGWCTAYWVGHPIGGGQSEGEGRTFGPMPFLLKFAEAWLVDWCAPEAIPDSRSDFASWIRKQK